MNCIFSTGTELYFCLLTQNLSNFFFSRIFPNLSKIRDPEKPIRDPRFRGQKAPDSGVQIKDQDQEKQDPDQFFIFIYKCSALGLQNCFHPFLKNYLQSLMTSNL